VNEAECVRFTPGRIVRHHAARTLFLERRHWRISAAGAAAGIGVLLGGVFRVFWQPAP
jgi:hypothetical protein